MRAQQTLINAFSLALGIDAGQVNEQLVYNSIPQWDSTAHMILIAQIEADFKLMLDTDDIIDLSSFAMAKTILSKYEIDFN